MTSEELNIKVAELMGWKECTYTGVSFQGIPPKLIYGLRPAPALEETDKRQWYWLPRYTSDLNAAFSLLEGLNFMVFTCDMGYSCKIYTAPEHGEEELAEGFADTVPVAICRAFVKLKGVKV